MPLQFRRGLQQDKENMTVPLAVGEPLFVTDTQQLFIGNGTTLGGIQVTGYTNEDAQEAVAQALLGADPTGAPDNTRHNNITFQYDNDNNRIDATVNFNGIAVLEADAFKGSLFADDSTMLVDGVNGKIVGPVDTASITFLDSTIQTTAYAGGQGRALMIDTNRIDEYTENGSADRPYKTFAAAIAAASALATAESAPAGDKRFTFVLMGCTVTEAVDFSNSGLTAITISTTCRSSIEGNVLIADIPTLSQLVIRNIEIGGTFTLTGDGTANQMNNCSFYNASFSGAVNITATNAAAFYEVAFFSPVTFTNLSYFYINGAQFNTDWTIRADDTGDYPVPSRGINPGSGGSVSIVFSVIANNVIFVKGGTAAFVFQPHMSRMGLGAGTYTVPAGWIMTPHSTVLRGTWVNNGSIGMRNSSSDNRIKGTAPSYVGTIGGEKVIAKSTPATSKGVEGDRQGMIAADANYLYVCVTDWTDGVADIWSRTAIAASTW